MSVKLNPAMAQITREICENVILGDGIQERIIAGALRAYLDIEDCGQLSFENSFGTAIVVIDHKHMALAEMAVAFVKELDLQEYDHVSVTVIGYLTESLEY